jgi:CHAD domain-containing protein
MAKARDIPDLDPDVPYALAAARVVRVRADELVEHGEGVLDVGQIERVHDMRVATRRLRAALEVFRPCFPQAEFKPALAEVKAVADALGERRDRDVTIAALEDFGEALPAPDRPGIESLVAELRIEQAEVNDELAEQIDPSRVAALRERLESLAAAAERSAAQPGEISMNGGDPVAGGA